MKRVFGIRHHGPGSARRLAKALPAWEPDIILIEGPPEGDALLDLALHEEMKPPVALLVYQRKNLKKAAFYPFVEYSPEWQAILYGLSAGIPIRFIDLSPAFFWQAEADDQHIPRKDPMQMIAEYSGFDHGENWWDAVVEGSLGDEDSFEQINALMREIRLKQHPQMTADYGTMLREAWMRKQIRKAEREGFERIAIVCGAFHAPVLEEGSAAKVDNKLLKGLKKVPSLATWIPWTYQRLSQNSGYGAGVLSPAWYGLLFRYSEEEVLEQWMVRCGRVFRAEGLDAAPAQAIDALRLAQNLAHLRGRELAGLDELLDAARTVFSFGDEVPMKLVFQKLVIGEERGNVPEGIPVLPLQKDIQQLQKSYRLRPQTAKKVLALDLRKEFDLNRSHFLQQTNIIGISWAWRMKTRRHEGTFREQWSLRWLEECELQIVEAASWGNTLAEAAEAKARYEIKGLTALGDLMQWLEKVLLAGLYQLVPGLSRQIKHQSNRHAHIGQLLDAVPPLVRVLRYGDVRQTAKHFFVEILDGLFPRLLISLPDASLQLEEEHAETLLEQLQALHEAVKLLEFSQEYSVLFRESVLDSWPLSLNTLAIKRGIHPKIAAWAARMLFDQNHWSEEHMTRHLAFILSQGSPGQEKAFWLEGFLLGSGQLLIHHPSLFFLLDQWIAALSDEAFQAIVPLLRRSFSRFTAAEKRNMYQLAEGGVGNQLQHIPRTYDQKRADEMLEVLKLMLGEENG